MPIENKMDTPVPLQIQSYGGFGRKRKPLVEKENHHLGRQWRKGHSQGRAAFQLQLEGEGSEKRLRLYERQLSERGVDFDVEILIFWPIGWWQQNSYCVS